MDRYFEDKDREFILLKSYPCVHSKCAFCTLHLDNDTATRSMLEINSQVISQIQGKGILEIYNSGSIFELPAATLFELRQKIREKKIKAVITEAHWLYRFHFKRMKKFLDATKVIIKVGVETFDPDLRENVMKKGMDGSSAQEIRSFTEGINLLVGFKGQTKNTVAMDLAAAQLFDHVDINILDGKYTPDPRNIDYELIAWFLKEFSYLRQMKGFRIFESVDDAGIGDSLVR